MSEPRVIVALDFPEARPALDLAARVEPALCRLKIGKELFAAAGPQLVEQLAARGFDVFLDLKFHDIPNTVASACRAAANLGAWMVDVHALGGVAMMAAAREAVAGAARPPLLVAVTVLTSMGPQDLAQIGITLSPERAVSNLAGLARAAGLDGVVCSAREAAVLRRELGPEFLLVTPGIRPAGAERGDQVRIATPADAVRAGASYLVIGRPVTQASDPARALAEINAEIEGAS